jgi:predicted  nucleic acid-binding Zn-ribbon protein
MQCEVPVSIGELFDKLAVLRVKLKKITDPEKFKAVSHEYYLLLSIVDSLIGHDPRLKEPLAELEKVNERLWDILEDQRLKEHKKQFDETFITLSRNVYLANDKRFEIKNQINELTSSKIREQKHYSQ